MRYFVDEEGGVEMARDGVQGKKSTDLVVYVINEATKLLKGTSVLPDVLFRLHSPVVPKGGWLKPKDPFVQVPSPGHSPSHRT